MSFERLQWLSKMGKVFLFFILKAVCNFSCFLAFCCIFINSFDYQIPFIGPLKKEGEYCGPLDFSAAVDHQFGECEPGLKCDLSLQEILPISPGVCKN